MLWRKLRADQFLVQNGYFESRSKAQAAIKAGKVSVDGVAITKPSQTISQNATVKAEAEHPWVSRGGLKLVGALKTFDISVKDRVCLDIGSSTGGFTDVLLSRGALKVYAVDVGRDQLHSKLRTDDRVVSMESQDARKLTADMFDPLPDILVCDASFISLAKVIERPLSLMQSGSEAILLFKPQFEVGRKNIGKGGIVKHGGAIQQVFTKFQDWISRQGWTVIASGTSPIKGGDGNIEYLINVMKL